jgi:hypothetical protein
MIISGTVANAVKMQTLDNQWQQKKASGDILSKKERNERANWTQEDWLKYHFEEQAAQNREASKRTELANKILSGGTLTSEEEQYLEQEDPATLQKYRQIKIEKKAYEEKLKHCRTKDEVQRVKLETMGEYAAAMKKVENDPYIPKSEKLAKAQELLAKTRNVQEAERKFMQSPEYDSLPTEAEEAEERSEERELEQEQNLQTIEEAVSDADGEETQEEAVDTVDDAEDNEENHAKKARLQDVQEDETEDSPSRVDAGALDVLQDIEETFRRIQFIVQSAEGGSADSRKKSGKSSGGQINVIV